MNAAAHKHYQSRFRRVLEYVDAHLDDELSVDLLSQVAAFSKFHFHRQFSAQFGMSLSKYVQLSRLKRASYEVVYRTEKPIVEIALGSHYEGPEAFSRAFKKVFGQTPSEFRRNPKWTAWGEIIQPLSVIKDKHQQNTLSMDQVQVVAFPATKVAMLPYQGDPRYLGESIRQLVEWRRTSDSAPRTYRVFDLIYNDRNLDKPEDFRMDLCFATDRDVGENTYGIITSTIPAGSCALLRHYGSTDLIHAAVDFLYAQWLPHSGAELRDFPMFFERVKLFPDVAESDGITDVYLPLESKPTHIPAEIKQ